MPVPVWKYHQELCPEGKIIHCEKELASLSGQWVDSPADFKEEKQPAQKCEVPSNYHEHMEQWPAKKEEAKPKRAKALKAK